MSEIDSPPSHPAARISPDQVEVRERDGFSYRPLVQTPEGRGFNVNLVDVHGRHYKTAMQGGATRNYFVIDGEGTLTLDGQAHEVHRGDLFVIPDGHDYEYEGTMQLFEFNIPGTTKENERNLDATSG